MSKDFTKEFFQQAWGEEGYYEHFNYGVGIERVYAECFEDKYPFWETILEIGSGGGSFTEDLVYDFKKVICVDVIPIPQNLKQYKNIKYIELPNHSNDLPEVYDHSVAVCFCYNVFCHMSNDFLCGYIRSVKRVLRKGGDFYFMLSNFNQIKQHVPDPEKYKLGDLLPMGHFYQDERTLDLIADPKDWEIVSRNMIPEHRDIIIHLKKK